MRVFSIDGEPTRFRVESTSLECPACAKLFPRLQPKNKDLRIGDQCPACAAKIIEEFSEQTETPEDAAARVPKLDARFHLTDVAVAWPVGRCECESWKYNLLKRIKLIPKAELGELTHTRIHALRCSHLEAAWTQYGLNKCRDEEATRLALAQGRTEEDQP